MTATMKVTNLQNESSATPNIVLNADGTTTIPTQSTTNLSYTGTLTGGTGVINIGSGQVYKAADGKVGIGSIAPSSKFQIDGTTSINGSNATYTGTIQINESVASAQAIGGLEFKSASFGSGYGWKIASLDSSGAQLTFNSRQNSATWSENMRIDSSGNLLVGTTTNNSRAPRLALNGGSVTWSVGPSASNSAFVVYNASEAGVFMGDGSTSWGSSSDERLKTDLVPIENAVEKVKTLRSLTGRFKSDEEGTSRAFLIAQDVLAVFPEAVDTTNPDKLGLRYTELIPLLTAAIQELKAEFDAYKAAHP